VWRNEKWCSSEGNSKLLFEKNFKMELPYDPGILLLIQHAKELNPGFLKDVCIFLYITTLFTIAKTWKQPKNPLTGEWAGKMWLIHIMEYYSTLKM
jgi:hypothetical protein